MDLTHHLMESARRERLISFVIAKLTIGLIKSSLGLLAVRPNIAAFIQEKTDTIVSQIQSICISLNSLRLRQYFPCTDEFT